jgi:hypothetical protein
VPPLIKDINKTMGYLVLIMIIRHIEQIIGHTMSYILRYAHRP